jgi:2-oxoisovalerate dehydrogenase E1 component
MVETAVAAAEQCGRSVDVWNLFSISPLRLEVIEESLAKSGRLLVVQESGATAGLGDLVISRLCRSSFADLKKPPVLVSAPDTPVPFAPELEAVYRPDVAGVSRAMVQILGEKP